jgi:hypothetical protein
MGEENIINSALLQALRNIFGEVMAQHLIEHLKEEHAMKEDGVVDIHKLELALQQLFGSSTLGVMQRMMVTQKSSLRALR